MPQHLKDFFDRYDGFDYDPTQPPTSEFRRLCKSHEWVSPDSGVKQTPFFRAALVREFNSMYGRADTEFHHYERLCRVLNIELVSVDECRQVRCSSPFVMAL